MGQCDSGKTYIAIIGIIIPIIPIITQYNDFPIMIN